MSLQSDPRAMVRTYGQRTRQFMPSDLWVSLSRRGLEAPAYRIAVNVAWAGGEPWTQKEKLPLLEEGLLAELIYGDEPRIIDDIALLKPDDPRALPPGPAAS
ncbi:MAG: hypothetical protein U0790_12780 [Isosphaeraceae bacterium]